MPKIFYSTIIFLLIITSVFTRSMSYSGTKKVSTKSWKYVPGIVIVKFKTASVEGSVMSAGQEVSQMTINSMVSKYRLLSSRKMFAHLSKNPLSSIRNMYRFTAAIGVDIEALAQSIERESSVEFAEPDYLIPVNDIPNDPRYSQQPYLSQVKAPQAWNVIHGDSSVIIGIIDTGIQWDHPDLANAIWNNAGETGTDSSGADKKSNGVDDDGNGLVDDYQGYDWVDGGTNGASGEDVYTPDNDPMDRHGHGTHVSGLSGAISNNGVGIASLPWRVTLLPLRAGFATVDGNGVVQSSAVAQAFVYATDMGASVINLSAGSNATMFEGARYAFENGAIITTAAGNDNAETSIGEIQSAPWALTTAALNQNDGKSSYSNYGDGVKVCAPGGDAGALLLSTLTGSSYGELAGTSMSAPIVAGLAALVKSQHPDWPNWKVTFQILGTADNIDARNPYFVGKLGYGRINAYRAVTESTAFTSMKPQISIQDFHLQEITGNGNGKLEPGESAQFIISLHNEFADATNLQASLSTNDQMGVTINKGTSAYGDLPGISHLYQSSKDNSSDPFEISIDANAISHQVHCTLQLNDDNGFSKSIELSFPIEPLVLIVDDDRVGGDGTNFEVEGYATRALDSLHVSYDIWDHDNRGTPSATFMSNYSSVIWLCEWAFPSLDSADRAEVGQYLDGGGRLFLSGQDIGWDLNERNLPDGVITEFVRSGGQSKLFYEKYFKARYVADDADATQIIGIAGDPIGEGINTMITQPGRPTEYQFPDMMLPLTGGRAMFIYPTESVGAIRYEGIWRTVYFGFGFEAITDDSIRNEVMKRVLRWLNGYTINYAQLTNREDTLTPIPIEVQTTSIDSIVSVDFFWDSDGSFPWNRVTLSSEGNGIYAGSFLPPTGDITYLTLVRTTKGVLPYTMKSFHLGADNIPPQISTVTKLENTIDPVGPYTIFFTGTDNLGLDINSALLHFSATGYPDDSILATYNGVKFSGTLSFPQPLHSGDSVYYYLTLEDSSQQHNRTRYPAQGYLAFVVGRQLYSFSEEDTRWDYGLTWGRENTKSHSGGWSLKDYPYRWYAHNTENILTLQQGWNLSNYSKAVFRFWRYVMILTSDTCFVEITRDGTNWERLKALNGLKNSWVIEEFNIEALGYVREGNENVRVRFRFVSDQTYNGPGIWIDDIEIMADTLVITDVKREPSDYIPENFYLAQNFPNPFNPTTEIYYSISDVAQVVLKIFNVLGQQVTTVVEERQSPGVYHVQWNAGSIPGGVYFYRLEAIGFLEKSKSFTQIKKMILLK